MKKQLIYLTFLISLTNVFSQNVNDTVIVIYGDTIKKIEENKKANDLFFSIIKRYDSINNIYQNFLVTEYQNEYPHGLQMEYSLSGKLYYLSYIKDYSCMVSDTISKSIIGIGDERGVIIQEFFNMEGIVVLGSLTENKISGFIILDKNNKIRNKFLLDNHSRISKRIYFDKDEKPIRIIFFTKKMKIKGDFLIIEKDRDKNFIEYNYWKKQGKYHK